jgi:AraC-like DNA-binding protein/mannose-6-phosphate isomerase-like protein (cupin superfamily)
MNSNREQILVDPTDERHILDFRPLGMNDVPILGRYSYSSARDPLEMHSHGERLEICYLESGRQTYIVEGESFELSGGDLFVTFPKERHGTGEGPEGKGVLYWAIVRVPGPKERFLSLPPKEGGLIIDRLLQLPQRTIRGGKMVERTLHRIFSVYDQAESQLRIVSLRNLLIRMLLDVLNTFEQAEPMVSPLIRDVQQFALENLDQPLVVADLASRAGLSASRLKARFKAETGIPPADYMTRMKVEAAKDRLLQENQSVTEIAMELGFATSQYFATVFKRYTGKTPSKFRLETKQD